MINRPVGGFIIFAYVNPLQFSANQIVFEDNHLIIIDKQVGQLVQGDKTGHPSLLDEIKHFLKTRDSKTGNVFLGLIHRLDRPTSGLVIYAKTSKSLSRMTKLIKERKIKKVYRAWVQGLWPVSENVMTVENWLRKNEKLNKSFVSEVEKKGYKKAISKIRWIKSLEKYSLLEIELITGRHHQIRAQLGFLGYPIKGDKKYGAKKANPDGGISLCAYQLEFQHPVTEKWINVKSKCFCSSHL